MKLNQIGSIDQYKYWNNKTVSYWISYDNELNKKFSIITEKLFEYIDIKKNHKVLDVGCGSGHTSKICSNKVGINGEVLGIDISLPMLDLFKKTNKGIKNIKSKQVDIQNHSFKKKKFDHVISRFGLMFFDNPTLAFHNIYKSLKKSGFLTFVCWKDINYNQFFSLPALAVTNVIGVKRPHINKKAGPFSFNNDKYIYKILNNNNFRNIKIVEIKTFLPANDINNDIEILINIGIGARMIRDLKLNYLEKNKIKDELKNLLIKSIYRKKKDYKAKISLVIAQK
ncbi:MAG: Demethylmenaquinone methyltransferase [Alphaproteobacteria bacterium MarineAlpha9_Bin4]|nr:MAG: Demethylmenaquinone methyltransferase [Alphaproteobacteria bacterium MarineAlpha9_Bin4]